MNKLPAYDCFVAGDSPTVMVRHDILEAYGTPDIDHDNLARLFIDELNLPAAKMKLKLYGGTAMGMSPDPVDFWRKGFHVPYTNTFHIPVEGLSSTHETPMHGAIALGVKLARQRRRPRIIQPIGGEISVAGLIAIGVGAETQAGILGVLGVNALAYTGMYKVFAGDPGDQGNRHHQRVLELRKKHDSDIRFPAQSKHLFADKRD